MRDDVEMTMPPYSNHVLTMTEDADVPPGMYSRKPTQEQVRARALP